MVVNEDRPEFCFHGAYALMGETIIKKKKMQTHPVLSWQCGIGARKARFKGPSRMASRGPKLM